MTGSADSLGGGRRQHEWKRPAGLEARPGAYLHGRAEVSDLLELALHGLLAGAASRGSGRLAFRRALAFA